MIKANTDFLYMVGGLTIFSVITKCEKTYNYSVLKYPFWTAPRYLLNDSIGSCVALPHAMQNWKNNYYPLKCNT